MFGYGGGTQLLAMALAGAAHKRDDEQMEFSVKQSIPRSQTLDVYQERLQTIMKIAGGQKDLESRWWELRSVMDDYEWQDMQELLPESAEKNQLQTTPSEHSTTTGGMLGANPARPQDSSSSSPKVNAAKRMLSAEQEQIIQTNREAAALKKSRLQQTWL
jgi:hypothetical protein